MASRKFQFSQAVQGFITLIAQAADDGINARDVYNDRGYPPTGSDPITDANIAGLEITASDVEKAMQFFENLLNMLDGSQIAVADYDKTLNMLRTDV